MQTTFVAVLGFLAAAVSAAPGYPGGGSYDPCGEVLYGVAQCCAVDVLGVADLNCQGPSATPYSAEDFQSICASVGKQAACCVLPVLGQDVLCHPPLGL